MHNGIHPPPAGADSVPVSVSFNDVDFAGLSRSYYGSVWCALKVAY